MGNQERTIVTDMYRCVAVHTGLIGIQLGSGGQGLSLSKQR